MRFLKHLFLSVGAVALAGVLLTLVAPKAVHAAVAALVEIANTPANPVPNADVNAPGEEPFQTELCAAIGGSGCDTFVPATFVVPTTTSDGLNVKRLVIEAVGATCYNNGATQLLASFGTAINENQVSGSVYFNFVLPLIPSSAGNFTASSTPVRAYADPGTTVAAVLNGTATSPAGAACVYSVTGYFLTH